MNVDVSRLQLRDLESDFELEQRRGRELATHNRKVERQLQEIRLSSDEDKRMVIELSDSVQILTIKVKTLRRQLEEAVCITYTRYMVAFWTTILPQLYQI